MARAPSAKYFNSASRLTLSKNFRASAMNIGPDEMSGTRPTRIFEVFSCARTMAGAEAANDKAAVPVRRRRRSIFIGVSSDPGRAGRIPWPKGLFLRVRHEHSNCQVGKCGTNAQPQMIESDRDLRDDF